MKISIEEQNQIRRTLEESNSILEENITLLYQVKTPTDFLKQLRACTKTAGRAQNLIKDVLNTDATVNPRSTR